MWSFLMGKINNFTINLELTTKTTVFLKASKYLYFLLLVFITVYILFYYSYKSIFIVKIFIVKMLIVTINDSNDMFARNDSIITRKHSVKYRAREMVMETLQD